MNIPGFYNFRQGERGDPQVSMLVAAIPMIPVPPGGGPVLPVEEIDPTMDSLVLVYHLFLRERDPFCVIVPAQAQFRQ